MIGPALVAIGAVLLAGLVRRTLAWQLLAGSAVLILIWWGLGG